MIKMQQSWIGEKANEFEQQWFCIELNSWESNFLATKANDPETPIP